MDETEVKLATDYRVLAWCRTHYGCTWLGDFHRALKAIWTKRNGKNGVIVGDYELFLLYECGDYSRAQADAIKLRPDGRKIV